MNDESTPVIWDTLLGIEQQPRDGSAWEAVAETLRAIEGQVDEERQELMRRFRTKLHGYWGEPLRKTSLLCNLLHFVAMLRVKEHNVSEDEDTEVVLAVAAKATRAALETVQLLWCGFGYGARSKWRTFYELTVVLQIMTSTQMSPKLAADYRDHQKLQHILELRWWLRHLEKCGLERIPVPPQQVANVKAALERFEEEAKNLIETEPLSGRFAKNPWGWARSLDEKQTRWGFRRLLEHVPLDLACLEHFYRAASGEIHGTTPGMILNRERLPYGERQPGDATLSGMGEAGVELCRTLPWSLRAVIRLKVSGSGMQSAQALIPAVWHIAADAANQWGQLQDSDELNRLLAEFWPSPESP